jgi:hypothetical protein
MTVETILAAAYATFLIAVAACLELAARHSHRRSERMALSGFRFDPKLDFWTCPQEQKLVRAEADYLRHTVIYRAPAHVCNACVIKLRCTDSSGGRAIERAPDSWLQSELRRFHRGISLTLFALAALILIAELFRSRSAAERAMLAAILGAILAGGARLFSALTSNTVPKPDANP